jgi:VanZ family protein
MTWVVIPLDNSTHLEKITIIHFRADHLLHVAIFIPWAFFCIRQLKKNLLPWFVWGILYAAISEGLQCLVPYRSCNISDMLANMIGVVVGFIIFVSIRKTVLSFK